ncbi:MAG: helix-turn-helix domain-containing protein, partial [Prevotellaceae bacterium]|nr:helix-turn-helix domain-containing protein [Prevotellaceae bacterium]
AETLAGIVREMSIWLWRNHRDKCAIRVAIGKRLEELRKTRGLSQEELASRIGFKQPNIARIESARYATSIDILGYIADALSCRIELVPNEEKPPG